MYHYRDRNLSHYEIFGPGCTSAQWRGVTVSQERERESENQLTFFLSQLSYSRASTSTSIYGTAARVQQPEYSSPSIRTVQLHSSPSTGTAARVQQQPEYSSPSLQAVQL
eukprot:COSAG01_NODE_12_length_41732_cov_160.472964_9_plen_110_part_00